MMNTTQARRGLVAALAFMLPFLSLVTLWGVSLSSFLFLLAALLWFTPCRAALAQHWTSVRVAQGVTDVRSWHARGSAYTNMGIRMELWKAAGQLISGRPLLSGSLPEARREMARRMAQGTLDPVVLPAVHFHHDVVHMLVTGGVAGLFAWLSILAAPLIFFCVQPAPWRWRALGACAGRHAGGDQLLLLRLDRGDILVG